MTITEEYAPGRHLDVHGDGITGAALFWHGRGPNERSAMTPLAEAVAAQGVRVFVADWDSTATDFGRSDLIASLEYARGMCADIGVDADRLVLVGWSLGGTAALGLALQDAGADRRAIATILIAPGDGPRATVAFTGQPLPATFPPGAGQPTIEVFHGSLDDISHPELVRGLVQRLRRAGWSTRTRALEADHAGVVMTTYEPNARRCVRTSDPRVLDAGRRVAAAIVAAATRS